MTHPQIMSYEQAAEFLAPFEWQGWRGTGQKGTTIVRRGPGLIAVRYHDTDVVTYCHPQMVDREALVTLGGWTTEATIARINEYAPEWVNLWRREDGNILLTDLVNGVSRPLDKNEVYIVARQHSFDWGRILPQL